MSDLQRSKRQERQKRDAMLNRVVLATAAGMTMLAATSASAEEGGAIVSTSDINGKITAQEGEMISTGNAMIGLVIIVVMFMMVRRVLR